MAKTSFTQLSEDEGPTAPEEQTPKQEVAVPQKHHAIPEGVEGEVGNSDIQLPRLNLVQKMSELVDAGFAPGAFVYNKELQLGQPLEVVVTRIRKQYQQVLPYGSEDTPDVCDTAEEVRARGGSTEYGEENYYGPMAHLALLVAKPEGCAEEWEGLFPYRAAGRDWAPAVLTVAKSSYAPCAKPVFTAAMGPLRAGLTKGKWHLTAQQKSSPKGTWHVPVMKLCGTTDGSVAEIAGLLG